MIEGAPPPVVWRYCLVLLFLVTCSRANTPVRVGLLTSENEHQNVINDVTTSGPIQVVPVLIPEDHDLLSVRQKVCESIDEGVVGIIDATLDGSFVSQIIGHLTDKHGVPNLSVGSQKRDSNREFTLRLHPTSGAVRQAIKDIITSLDWRSFTVLYDSMDNLAIVEDFLNDAEININLVKIGNNSEIRNALESVAQYNEDKFVLALNNNHLNKVLRVAQRVGLTTPRHKYLSTSLDIDELVFKEFLQNSESRVAVLTMKDSEANQDSFYHNLVIDAISTLSVAVNNAGELVPQSTLCETDSVSNIGHHLLNELKKVTFGGKTGLVSFDENGDRNGLNFTLVQMYKDTARPLLNWNPSTGVTAADWTHPKYHSGVSNKVKRQLPMLTVSTHLATPYVMLKEGAEDGRLPLSVKDRYEGLCIDILDEIAAEIGFDYQLIVKEGPVGSFDENTGDWNGLVGDLASRATQVVIGDITVTRQRESVIDFTKPWHTLGVGILGYRRTDYAVSIFAFLSPFSVELWLILLVTFILTTIVFFIIARLSPIERTPPYKGETLTWSPYTLLNSGWFIVSALLRQTPIQQPRALSTRFLGGVWWLFTLIIVAVYFVGLIAFFNAKKLEEPIESVYDLANQHKIKYGAVYEGSTWLHFKKSQVPVYQRIYAGLANSRSQYQPKNSFEAIEMIKSSEGNYMFFMEEPTLEYITERDCNMQRIGGTVGPMRAYAFGLVKGSPYLDRFNEVIVNMRETGLLRVIYQKWIHEKMGVGFCEPRNPDASFEDTATELGIVNVAGAFIILVVGVVVALLIAIIECLCKAAINAKQKGDPMCSEVAVQLKQAVNGPPSVNPNIAGSSQNVE